MSELSVVVEILTDAVQRVEEKTDRVLIDVAELKALREDVAQLRSDLSSMQQVVGRWKSGAAIVFAMGGFCVWALDHWAMLKKFIGL
jgi:hypothetical protein